MEEAKIVDLLCKVGKKVRNHFSGLTTRFEFPEWFGDVSGRSFKSHRWNPRRFLAMEFVEVGFVVKGIDVGYRAGAIDDQHPFRSSLVMGRTGKVG